MGISCAMYLWLINNKLGMFKSRKNVCCLIWVENHVCCVCTWPIYSCIVVCLTARCIPCVYHLYTMCIPRVYHVYTICIPCVYHVYTMCIPCVYHAWLLTSTNTASCKLIMSSLHISGIQLCNGVMVDMFQIWPTLYVLKVSPVSAFEMCWTACNFRFTCHIGVGCCAWQPGVYHVYTTCIPRVYHVYTVCVCHL